MQDRQAAAALIERLAADGHRFSFFQLVQLLLRQSEGALAPGGPGPPRRETVRFRPSTGLGFSASDVSGIDIVPASDEDDPARYLVTVNFMGLYGPASPMPTHLTEDLIWSGTDGETLRDFLDLFDHRFISFIYAAWEKYRHYIRFVAEEPDSFTRATLSLVGLGSEGMIPALDASWLSLLRVAGLLNTSPRSAVGLECMLRELFEGTPIQIESFIRRTVRIPADQVMRLGRSGCRLGEDAVLGELVQDMEGGFRITLSPLSASQYKSLLPGSDAFNRIVRMTRFYACDPFQFDLRMVIRPEEVPPLCLSPDLGLALGQMSWLSPSGAEQGEGLFQTRGYDPLRAAHGAAGVRELPRPGE
jgi:type VI secretion system protein ImpH